MSNSDVRARECLEELAAYTTFLAEACGYQTYDPQLDRFIYLPDDAQAVLDYYFGAADTAMRPTLKEPPRPWCRFW